MPVRLQRKARKKKIKAAKRRATMKQLMFTPVIRCVDEGVMRENFSKKLVPSETLDPISMKL